VHHAGNSSAIVDGAALVLVGSQKGGAAAGLRPRARVRALASVGSEPTAMLTGPTPAVQKALARAGMQVGDVDLWEINEAFAVVPLQTVRALNIDLERVNVNGGSIALGHPLGATGAILLGTVLDELERRNLSTACVTLCVGGGMGTATLIERV
jgi:acetyl-CoA C-acetyltransferase